MGNWFVVVGSLRYGMGGGQVRVAWLGGGLGGKCRVFLALCCPWLGLFQAVDLVLGWVRHQLIRGA